jgi:hypothetical protein
VRRQIVAIAHGFLDGLIKIPEIFKGRIPGLAAVSNTEAWAG